MCSILDIVTETYEKNGSASDNTERHINPNLGWNESPEYGSE